MQTTQRDAFHSVHVFVLRIEVFLLLKESPGDNIKILKSNCLLSTLYAWKSLYENPYKGPQNTDSVLKTAPKKLMTLRNRGDILPGNFLRSKPKKQERSLYRVGRLQSSWFIGFTLQRARPKDGRLKQFACSQLQGMKEVSFTVCSDSYKLHSAWNYPSPIPFKLAQPQTLSWLQQGTRTPPHVSDVPDGSMQAVVRQIFVFTLKAALSRQHSQNQSGSNVRLRSSHMPAHQLRAQESQRRGSKKRSWRKLVYEHLFP